MAQWKPTFKINGVTVPIPDNYNMVIADLSSDESGRTLDGKMHKDIIGVKVSIPFTWESLEWSVAATLCNAVDGKSSITVEYIDIRNPYTMTSKKVYIGDRSAEPVSFGTDGKVYWKVSFSEIEV